MKIHNFRMGFATNSSSSHSVILLPEGMTASDVSEIEDHYDDQYGWEFFRLSSTESKLRYLAAQMFSSRSFTDEQIIKIMQEYIPDYGNTIDLERDNNAWDNQPSIDHQSVYDKFDPKEMIKLFLNDRIVILGGNDNSDGYDNDPCASNHVPSAKLLLSGEASVRSKCENDNLVIYNIKDGNKIRIGKDDSEYTKSITPELVDLKITNYCNKGCNFCYQSSTEEGQHADYDYILGILDMLQEMNVFEVAIGGGEPTSHPRFHDILKECASRNITPNFTTLAGDWMIDDFDYDIVGGIGVSVSNKKALSLVKTIKSKMPYGVKTMAQHVMESVPFDVTAQLLNEAKNQRVQTLLLGFKDVGFGLDYQRHGYNDDVAVLMKLSLEDFSTGWVPLSVDTAFVDQYPDVLKMLGTPEELTSSPEGKFSCYIDAVEKKTGPSSYIPEDQMEDMVYTVDSFKEVYSKW